MDARANRSPLTSRQLTAARCWQDRLGIIMLFSGAAVVLVATPGVWAFLGGLAALAVLLAMHGALSLATLLSTCLPVGRMVAQSWYRAVRSVYALTGLTFSELPVVLLQNPTPNAFSVWAVSGRSVVITSGLVSLLREDPATQRFIVGHEVAHSLFHQPWQAIASAATLLPGPFGLIGRILFLGWLRAAERSADRVGLICAGSVLAGVQVLLALSAGRAPARDELVPLLQQLPKRPGGIFGYVAEILSSHPFLRPRIEALLSYAGSPAFARIAGKQTAEAIRLELVQLGRSGAVKG